MNESMNSLVDRESISRKILQDSRTLGKSCKILTENSILVRFLDAMAFLQDSCKKLIYHKNLAKFS